MATFKIRTPDGRIINVEAVDKVEAVRKAQALDQLPKVPVGPEGKPQPAAAPAPRMPLREQAADVAVQGGIGLGEAALGVPGMFGDARELKSSLTRAMGRKMGIDEKTLNYVTKDNLISKLLANLFPSTEDYINAVEGVTGKFPEAKTKFGKYARTTTNMAANAALPGGPVRKLAAVVGPGVITETAGQMAEGMPEEGAIRAGAAIASGAAFGRPRNMARLKKIGKQAPTRDQLNAARDSLYDELRAADVRLDANGFNERMFDLQTRLNKQGMREARTPMAHDALRKISEMLKRNPSPTFDDLEEMHATVNNAFTKLDNFGKPDAEEIRMASQIKEALNDAMDSVAYTHNGTLKGRLGETTKAAKMLAQRSIKARMLEHMVEAAKGYQSGVENGLRLQFQTIMRRPELMKGFTQTEQEAIRKVAKGTPLRNFAATFGRMGIDLSEEGNVSWIGPTTGVITGGTTTGVMSGDPLVGALGAGGMLAGSSGLKVGARKLGKKHAQTAIDVMRAGPRVQDLVPRQPSNRALLSIMSGAGSRYGMPEDELPPGVMGE